MSEISPAEIWILMKRGSNDLLEKVRSPVIPIVTAVFDPKQDVEISGSSTQQLDVPDGGFRVRRKEIDSLRQEKIDLYE